MPLHLALAELFDALSFRRGIRLSVNLWHQNVGAKLDNCLPHRITGLDSVEMGQLLSLSGIAFRQKRTISPIISAAPFATAQLVIQLPSVYRSITIVIK